MVTDVHAETLRLLREYWRYIHSEECAPWFPHGPEDDPCKFPEPDVLKNAPDSPYSY
jgi:hypothetical protein